MQKDEDAGVAPASNGQSTMSASPTPTPKKIEIHPAFYVGYITSRILANVPGYGSSLVDPSFSLTNGSSIQQDSVLSRSISCLIRQDSPSS